MSPNCYDDDYKHRMTIPLNTNDLTYWSYQVVKGMEYLAKMNVCFCIPKIFYFTTSEFCIFPLQVVHRNLTAKNILLAKGNVVKICNFRLAKIIDNSECHIEESDKV